MTRTQRMAFGLTMIAIAGCSDNTGNGTEGSPGCVMLGDGTCVEETFHNPPVLQPNDDGVYELNLEPTEFSFNGQRHCGRAFNGMYPAPTIDTAAQSGGKARKIRVNLRNKLSKSDYHGLPADPCTCMDEVSHTSCTPDHENPNDTCMCMAGDGSMCHLFDFNVTNLHAHGSHVRPNFAAGGGCDEKDGLRCRACSDDPDGGARTCFYSDDVLARVHPGEGTQIRWDIDEDGVHHPGLDWYHPHIHGSTAIQVASGAAGAWIVRGDVDEVPGIKDARERLMVLSTPPIVYAPLADGEPCDEEHLTFNSFYELQSITGTETNLVNGIRRPRMLMPPGQIERWRFIHTRRRAILHIPLERPPDSPGDPEQPKDREEQSFSPARRAQNPARRCFLASSWPPHASSSICLVGERLASAGVTALAAAAAPPRSLRPAPPNRRECRRRGRAAARLPAGDAAHSAVS